MLEEIKKTAAFIDAATSSFAPEVGIILGTGLGGFADKIDTAFAIEYKDIPGFPVSTVEGHKGRMIFGTVEGRKVVAMQGRFHYYEGYSVREIASLLGQSESAVSAHLSRGRKSLRTILGGDLYEQRV